MPIRALLIPLAFAALLSCTGTPPPADRPAETTGEAPASEAEGTEAAEIEELQRELVRARREAQQYRDEAQELRNRLEQLEQAGRGAAGEDPERLEQLQIENDRLRDLLEELRLALEAAGAPEDTPADAAADAPAGARADAAADTEADTPATAQAVDPSAGDTSGTPNSAAAPYSSYRRVDNLAAADGEGTPARLAAQELLRIEEEEGGFRYLDRRVARSESSALYLEILLPPGGRDPVAELKARTVYPLSREPLNMERVTIILAGQRFVFDIEEPELRRTALMASETGTAGVGEGETAAFLRFFQRRSDDQIGMEFSGNGGTLEHRVTPEERRALANMLYTYRELGGELTSP